MKTYSALTQALCMATGVSSSLLEPIAPMPVLFVEEEGGTAETKERVLGICKTLEIETNDPRLKNLYFAHRKRTKLDEPDWRHSLVSLVKRRGIKVAYFDALVYMHSADENKVSEMAPVLDTLQMIREAGSTAVYMCHLDKSRGEDRKADIDSQVRGAGVLTDAYDIHLAYRRYKMSEGHIDLTVRARSAGEERYSVAWQIENHKEGDRDIIDLAKLSMVRLNEGADREQQVMRCYDSLEPGRLYSVKDCKEFWSTGLRATKQTMADLVEKGLCEFSGASIRLVGEN